MQRVARSVGVSDGEIKRFVTQSPWEYGRVQAHLVEEVPEGLASMKGAFIVDDVGIIKQGKHSVGVYRQYSGALGKVGNCQVAVNLVYSVPDGKLNADQRTWPLGTRLYVPQAWAEAEEFEELRQEVHFPEDFKFRTKPEMAIEMIDAARRAGIPHCVTLGDAGYGDSNEFRQALRERGEPYIVGITPSKHRFIDASVKLEVPKNPRGRAGARFERERYGDSVRPFSATKLRKDTVWEEVSWTEGTKGRLSGQFSRRKVRVTNDTKLRYVTDEECWLLLEERGNELKAYLCWGLEDATLENLVQYAHLRWTIEQFHRESKQILGFDRFEGRTWRGWHHHITMVLLAYAFLATQRASTGSRNLPTIPAVAKALVIEKETQAYIVEGIPRAKARRLAEGAIRRLTDW